MAAEVCFGNFIQNLLVTGIWMSLLSMAGNVLQIGNRFNVANVPRLYVGGV